MKLRIAIFEDDRDLADLLEELLESNKYSVNSFLTLKNINWGEIDLCLGDYRNTLVPFKELSALTESHGVPLIAISGGDMDYPHQLSKPFSIEELESLMFKMLKGGGQRMNQEKKGVLSKWLNKIIPE